MDLQGRAASWEALCLCKQHLSLKQLDFQSPRKVPAGPSWTTARGLAWTGDRSGDGPVPLPGMAGLDWFAGTSMVCSTNTDKYPDHWPGGSSSHLASGHLFLKQTGFQLPRGLTRAEKVCFCLLGCCAPLPRWKARETAASRVPARLPT